MKRRTGADDRRGNEVSQRDGWGEGSLSSISIGSHEDSGSVVSDMRSGRSKDFLGMTCKDKKPGVLECWDLDKVCATPARSSALHQSLGLQGVSFSRLLIRHHRFE